MWIILIILGNYGSDYKCNFLVFVFFLSSLNKQKKIPHFTGERNNMLKPEKLKLNASPLMKVMKEKEEHFSFVCHGPAIIFLLLQTVETMCGSEGGERDKWFEKGHVCLVAGCYGNIKKAYKSFTNS